MSSVKYKTEGVEVCRTLPTFLLSSKERRRGQMRVRGKGRALQRVLVPAVLRGSDWREKYRETRRKRKRRMFQEEENCFLDYKGLEEGSRMSRL